MSDKMANILGMTALIVLAIAYFVSLVIRMVRYIIKLIAGKNEPEIKVIETQPNEHEQEVPHDEPALYMSSAAPVDKKEEIEHKKEATPDLEKLNKMNDEKMLVTKEELYNMSEEFQPLQNKVASARQEIAKQVFGMEGMIDQCFTALLSGGHVLCEGLPGLAKTTLAKAFSKVVSCRFRRCQFSPDLLPSDLIGDRIFNQKTSEFDFKEGPVFTQILLADEINRAPAKTQAALLEVMQESQVTIFGEQHLIGSVEGVDDTRQSQRIFFAIATQNPIEQEGTYRLPEAQLDRFMFRLFFQWPERNAELAILNLENGYQPPEIKPCFTAKEILEWREKIARDVTASDAIKEQIVDLMRATREHRDILVGAGPRACQVLLRGAKVIAAINGRDTVLEEDVRAVAFDALNHRIVLKPDVVFDNPDANPLDIVRKIINDTLVSVGKRA
ncbi:MAG: AAA family ATPase [Victivallales bacterium]|nr:AAA family ATPase [Victivallales bacterium]